ncbi:penicillin acylase family protein [Sphingomonas lenta]|uniref:Acylase n=1 Tax=Sphingomonas lenta TaxID=1141887 RepID=A0A2A2SDD3_9SPHN|nr:penicillin acylase family protein [Sphingomonas lenta]PAX07192.1 acylase [Sphingomonas lenta]
MIRRLAWGLAALLVVVALALAVWEPLAATRAAPPPVRAYDAVIARDRFGVPHIFGRTDADVAYGVAYAHAEDDFSTLQEVLAMTRGRLGAITGKDGAAVDYAAHLLGARDTVRRDYPKLPADVRALLDGYASGLNRYAERHAREIRLPRLFPVNGEDVAAGFVVRLPFFFGLDALLGALAGDEPIPAERPQGQDGAPVGQAVSENGSNAFAVAPRRSADGWTRLVSNSHQPWRGGVAWYELVVHSGEGWNFAGATFPGSPYPFLGHNEFLGWTNTVNRPDLIDVYRLATQGDAYRYDGRMRPLEKRRVWLPVKLFGPFTLPVPRTIYRAVQGPVMRGDKGDFAIRYAGADQLRMLEQYYRINRARSWDEWNRAMAINGVAATNFIYADRTGRIAMVYNAMFPRRKAGFDYGKVLPGDTSRAFEPGHLGWAAVPKNVDPPSGFLQNANNSPYLAAGRGSELLPQPPLLGVETDATNRGTRAVELLEADRSISQSDIERIKYDTGVSQRSWAARWFDRVLRAPGNDDAKPVLARWDWNFDGRGPADALAALVLREGNKWHYRRRAPTDPAEALKVSADYLGKHFGRLDPPLGEVLRLRQGGVDLPLDGGPDVLRAMALWDEADDGRLAVRHGDSFLMFMAWDREGRVRSRSIQPFGAATTRPDSPHYADQASLFAAKRTKPVLFHPRMLRGNVERVYRP